MMSDTRGLKDLESGGQTHRGKRNFGEKHHVQLGSRCTLPVKVSLIV